MAITEVVRLEIQTQQAQQNMESLSETINEQKLITIELERELQRLEQQLRNTPKTAMAAQRDLNQQINHVKDSISDQRLSLKELQVQQSQTREIDRYKDKQGQLSDTLKVSQEETTGLNMVTGGYASSLRRLQILFDFAKTKAIAFAGSLKAVQTALIATGIGALVVALGLIVGYWDEIVDFVTQAEKKQREYNESLQETKTLLQSNLNLVNKQIELQEELGESTEELKAKKREILNDIITTNAKLIDQLKIQAELEKTVTVQETKWAAIKRTLGAAIPILGIWRDTGAGRAEALRIQNERQIKINELESESLGAQLELLKIDRNRNKEKLKGLDLGKLLEEQTKKELAARHALLLEIEAIENEFFDKFKEKQQLEEQAVRDKYFRLITLAEQYGEDTDILEQARIDALTEISERYETERLDALNTFREQFEEFGELTIEQQRQQAIDELELLKTTEEEKREALAQVNEYYDKLEQQRKDELRRQELEDERILQQQKLALISDFFGAVSDVLGQQSRAGKAFAIAQALMNTYQGISNVWAEKAESGLVGAGLIQRLATSAIVAAQGFAAVRNIAQVKTPGGGGGGASTGGSTPRPPSFNMIGDRGGVSDIQSGIDGQEQPPARAYVVGNDVTTQQEMDRNAVNASGF
jgi:hypothetical protein